MTQHRAVEWLHTYGRRYPRAWESFARLLADPPAEWPSWCWCPIAGAAAILQQAGIEPGSPQAELEAPRLAALAAWRCTQGIYRVQPTLLAELLDTPITGDLPADVLTRLPEWCVYVETPGHIYGGELGVGGERRVLAGYWAHLESDATTGRAELRLVLDLERNDMIGLAVFLGGTIEQGVQAAIDASIADYRKMGLPAATIRRLREHGSDILAPAIGRLVSVLLYLCADDAEVDDRRPLPPRVVRGKKRPILPTPSTPVVHATGTRLGAALEAARASARDAGGSGAGGVTPHVRRAHWHTYWTGPRDGERRAVVRWLSPILVGLHGAPELATVRPVRNK